MARNNLRDFGRELQLATRGLSEGAIQIELAAFAKQELAKVVASGEGSTAYDRYVNGTLGAPEESVVVPGPILYDFIWWKDAIEFSLETLRNRSPVDSGLYKRSWFAMVDDRPVTDYDAIPRDATVYITNDQPYSRKIEVGHMKMSVEPGVVEDAAIAVRRRFGRIMFVTKTFIYLPNGYILKGVFSRGILPGSREKLRRDTRAGARMTYPTLELSYRGD